MLILAAMSAAVLYWRAPLWSFTTAEPIHDVTSIFVAPVGILDSKASFAAIESYVDTSPPAPPKLPDPIAPARLLDPDWKVAFDGA